MSYVEERAKEKFLRLIELHCSGEVKYNKTFLSWFGIHGGFQLELVLTLPKIYEGEVGFGEAMIRKDGRTVSLVLSDDEYNRALKAVEAISLVRHTASPKDILEEFLNE